MPLLGRWRRRSRFPAHLYAKPGCPRLRAHLDMSHYNCARPALGLASSIRSDALVGGRAPAFACAGKSVALSESADWTRRSPPSLQRAALALSAGVIGAGFLFPHRKRQRSRE